MVQCEYDNHNIHTSTLRHGININNSDIGQESHTYSTIYTKCTNTAYLKIKVRKSNPAKIQKLYIIIGVHRPWPQGGH